MKKSKKIAISFLTMLSVFSLSSIAQTLSGNNDEQITGKWTFQNGLKLYGGVDFYTNGLKPINIWSEVENYKSGIEIGIAEGAQHYLPIAVKGDVVIRKRGGGGNNGGKFVLTNAYAENHPNNTYAVTGIMGATTGGGLWVHNNGNVRIGEYNSIMPTERLVVEGNSLIVGNIGIDGTVKSKGLTVDGLLEAKEIRVSSAPGADFVFSDSYKLADLSEVEEFIRENRHLPEIPTANDMETNGINLAEMNKLLLQKIEELTLYIIGQEKRIEALEQKSR